MFNQQRCHKIFRKKRFGAAQIESVRLNSLRLRPIFRQSFCGKSGSHVIATGNNGHHVEPPPLCGTIVNFLYLHELQLDGKLRAREPRKRDRSLFMSRTRKKEEKLLLTRNLVSFDKSHPLMEAGFPQTQTLVLFVFVLSHRKQRLVQ